MSSMSGRALKSHDAYIPDVEGLGVEQLMGGTSSSSSPSLKNKIYKSRKFSWCSRFVFLILFIF